MTYKIIFGLGAIDVIASWFLRTDDTVAFIFWFLRTDATVAFILMMGGLILIKLDEMSKR